METKEETKLEKRVILTTGDIQTSRGMGFAELIGYLNRMQDEGLLEKIQGLGEMDQNAAAQMFEGDVRGQSRVHNFSFINEHYRTVFAAKLIPSDRLTEAHLDVLKKRFPNIMYDFYTVERDLEKVVQMAYSEAELPPMK